MYRRLLLGSYIVPIIGSITRESLKNSWESIEPRMGKFSCPWSWMWAAWTLSHMGDRMMVHWSCQPTGQGMHADAVWLPRGIIIVVSIITVAKRCNIGCTGTFYQMILRWLVKSWKTGMIVLNRSCSHILRNLWASLTIWSVLFLCWGNRTMTCKSMPIRLLHLWLMAMNKGLYQFTSILSAFTLHIYLGWSQEGKGHEWFNILVGVSAIRNAMAPEATCL